MWTRYPDMPVSPAIRETTPSAAATTGCTCGAKRSLPMWRRLPPSRGAPNGEPGGETQAAPPRRGKPSGGTDGAARGGSVVGGVVLGCLGVGVSGRVVVVGGAVAEVGSRTVVDGVSGAGVGVAPYVAAEGAT